MKVLILSGSPRKGGNSDVLCDAFARGATDAGHTVEKVFLKEKNVHYCTGCGLCVSNKGTCSQKDDMETIKDQMIGADVIVLATPIYFYTMCAQLKTVIDRCCFFYTQVKNKDFYYIMTAADADEDAMRRARVEFDGFLSCLEGATEKGSICGTGVWGKGEVQRTPAMKDAYEMGHKI